MEHIGIMKYLKLAVAIFSVCTMGSNAYAVVIDIPIDYTTDNLVGTADPGAAAANIANELIWANQILALAAGTTATILSVDYRTHDTDEYAGVLTDLGAFQDDSGSNSVDAGWDYVLGKYDGQNAGYVLFFLGGEASTIPLFSDDIWVNGANEGYQLSHWTVFSGVPDSHR